MHRKFQEGEHGVIQHPLLGKILQKVKLLRRRSSLSLIIGRRTINLQVSRDITGIKELRFWLLATKLLSR
jgi:hypothetical protein